MELMPFLRCRVIGEEISEKGWLVLFELFDKKRVSATVPNDFIYEKRLCRVREHSRGKDWIKVILPVPTSGGSCVLTINKNLIEWHN